MDKELKALDDSEFYEEFAKWWDDEGQYVRAGGGDYERSFAFQAFRHLMPQIAALRAQLSSQGGEAVEVVGYRVSLPDEPEIGRWFDEEAESEPSICQYEPLMTVAQHQRIMAAGAGSADHVGEVRCDGDMVWQIDGDPAVWRRLGEGAKLYTHPADQVAEPDAELVALLHDARLQLYQAYISREDEEELQQMIKRIDAKLASLKPKGEQCAE
ncbi:MAG: hypothetical protein KJ989_13230 [Gammaproteobacteria bacterium]|uniref:Uncharacterized protein n=1 Tax=viral metagenome TaxID=1070528 RepID=A0A6M3KKP6_9ZZZZ|nr:hypothetical protein [Gammaproteobacteria bacterium]MBU2157177.1 hypothetical protein [Gammaproteobacteria bacterium]MBU2256091.1 hypothetical protein [Gammaproteobacteria bacterium]MBU2295159.1 hypothetical protein [Gammaproteobacteria bacterium]